MTRLLVHVEGQTEEDFVNQVLAPHLHNFGFSKVSARLMGNARQRSRRGGIRAWPTVLKEIVDHLKKDPASVATTMVDYYGLPQAGSRSWPGRSEARERTFPNNATTVEQALEAHVYQKMSSGLDRKRFVPYIMMHEFEAMLFSDCNRFAEGIGEPELAPKFQSIRNNFATPEEIDDSPQTAPSKRIESLVPWYEKPLMGTLAALEIGLEEIRSACPHFRGWLERLEGIPARLDA